FKDARWRSAVMLVANLGFLASFAHGPLALAPFAGFLAFGYAALWLARRRSRFALPVLIVATLAIFFYLKRYSFIPGAILLPPIYVTVGLSYVFFRVLHLIIDTGQGALEERVGPVAYINYTLNFTALVAGPIQTFQDWRDGHEGRPDLAALAWAGERIVVGCFKVMVASSVLDAIQAQARVQLLSGMGPLDPALQGAAVIALYPIYLYFNFSGYVDVVVGAARLMGLRLPENFDRPFVSASFIEFWSRWHITLSTWLKTYVYTPLMMSLMRRFPAPGVSSALTVMAFFVTFFLVGAWHGQTSEFLFFGVLQGGGVALNKLYQLQMTARLGRSGYRALSENAVYVALARGLTFTWFAFSLLWFWGDWRTLDRFATTLGAGDVVLALAVIWVVATIVLEVFARLTDALSPRYGLAPRALAAGAMIYLTAIYVLILNAAPPPVVYKAF
ncbi:MAG TPA: MBOAT family O-acyltransferase, partial [Phenylobacterium sp.]|nr:MBOAT family O-acyltransferase [Phenylobacterium sp.]